MGIHHGPRPTGNSINTNLLGRAGGGLFTFSSHTFTSPNQDPFAPDGSQIKGQGAYTGISWVINSNYFTVIDGIQYFKIPETRTYRITCKGATGKNPMTNGGAMLGYGGVVRGDFSLTLGTWIAMLIGQRPPSSGYTSSTFQGGAGGTFVATVTAAGGNTSATPLLVAGGGGTSRSTSNVSFCHGNMSPNGQNGSGRSGGTQGGYSAAGGHNQTGGGGAQGWAATQGAAHGDTRNLYIPTGYPGSTTSTAYLPARGFLYNGSPGRGGIFNTGYDTSHRGSGGFGTAGPGGWGGAGGGGGYSGGGNDNNGGYSGGGGSFISSSATNVGTSTGSWSAGSGYYSGHSGLATSSGLANVGYNGYANGEVTIEKV